MSIKDKFKTSKKRDPKAVIKRSEQRGGASFDNWINPDISLYSPEFGTNTVRFLPPSWDDSDHFAYDVFIHYQVGPQRQTYLCPESMGVGQCPICDEKRRAEADGDEDYARELRPKKRALCYVIDRDSEDDGVKAWAMPWTLDKEVALQCYDKRNNEVVVIDDPDDGCDVDFQKERNQGGYPNYSGIKVHRRESPLADSEELMNDWLEFVYKYPVPEQLVFYDYDHIKRVFEGRGPGADASPADEDDDDDDQPAMKHGPRTDYDDEDLPWNDDDSEDEGEEEEEDEKPRRHRRKAEGDEKEEQPRRRRRRSLDDED